MPQSESKTHCTSRHCVCKKATYPTSAPEGRTSTANHSSTSKLHQCCPMYVRLVFWLVSSHSLLGCKVKVWTLDVQE